MDDLRGFLLGRWALRRAINRDGDAFAGSAVFTEDGAGELNWRESGELRLGDYRGEAHRRYLIDPDGEERWTVRFDDRRPFHPLDLRSGRCEVEHECGPDVYRGVYVIGDDDRLAVSWRITGPGRADTILSRYRRLS